MPRDRAWARDRDGDDEPRVPAPALALVPLRLFLGITFVYAGAQKLSDPGFLHPGAPTYIGTQLAAFARGTPGGFLLRALALPHPQLAGVGVAVVEIVVGLLVFFGLLTRAAAAVGLLLNLVLFLTNSWKTYPYFLGSDIVFVFAWLPFVLAGAAGQPALDNSLDQLAVRRRRRRDRASRAPAVSDPAPAVTRRGLVTAALGATGVLAGAIAAISALAKGSYGAGPTRLGTGKATAAHSGRGARTQSARHAHSRGQAEVPSGAVRLAASSRLGKGQGAIYRDPADGQPDIIIRHGDGSLSAFSAVCTHAGCEVGYQGGEIVCPCHGGVYNAHTGAVEGGPPPAPLAVRRVQERGGEIFALPA